MAELLFDANKQIVSKTDLQGNITYCNKLFIELSGYSETELISKPHSIVRHHDMPKIVFSLMWETLKNGNEINAYVKNRTKNGDHYWVFANVTPSFDARGNIVGYHSVRRVPNKEKKEKIEALYKKLLSAERFGGVERSGNELREMMGGMSYEKFIQLF